MRVLLGVVAIAILTVIAWLFVRELNADAARAAGVAAAPEVESAERGALADPISPNQAAQDPVAEAPGEVREAVEIAADDNAIELRVVRETDDQLVIGAEVGYVADFTTEFWKQLSVADRTAMGHGDMDFYRRKGRVQTTDAAGHCRIPRPKAGLNLVVVFEDLYGTTYLKPDQQGPIIVKLRADRELVVRVAGFDGAPAAGVTVVMRDPASPQARQWQLGRTDARGELRQRHAQSYVAAGKGGVVALTAQGLGMASETREVNLTANRATEVNLVLPRGGSITFALVTDSGAPFDLTGFALPDCSLGIHKSKPDRSAAWNRWHPVGKFDRRGRITAQHVGLGQFYSVGIGRLKSDPVIGEGPTVARPEIVVPIALPEGLVVFRGRVVDAAGEPITSGSVHFTFRYGRGMASQESAITADGGFCIPQPHIRSGTKVEISGKIGGEDTPDLVTCLTEPWTIRPGINDLGECKFTEAPVLLTGHLVVPPSLSKLQQIWWQVEIKDPRWSQRYNLQTRWLGDRRFEVRGAVAEDAELRLQFQNGAHLPLEPLEFRPGTKDVEIVLQAAGSLTASFLIDKSGFASSLQLSLDQQDPAKPADPRTEMVRRMRDSYRLQPAGKDRLVANWTGLQPGAYRLRLECRGSPEPLATIGNIIVNGATIDPRLDGIDLRGRLRLIEIRVLDDTGRPLEQEDARVVLADTSGSNWYGHPLNKGAVRVTIMDRAKVRVLAKGFNLVEFDDVTADREIKLTRPPAVRFLVKWPFPLPAGITPQLQLRPVLGKSARSKRFHLGGGSSGSLENYVHSGGSIDAEGRATVRAMIGGPQTVRIAMDPHGRGHYFYSITPRKIEITGQAQEEIVLTVGEGRLRKTLDRLKKR